MSTITNLTLTTTLNAAQLGSHINFAQKLGVVQLSDFLNGMVMGAFSGTLVADVGAVKASDTLTLTGTVGTSETVVINGRTLTAGTVTNGSTFAVGTSFAQAATNLVSAIGSNANLAAQVSAATVNGTSSAVITVTALVAGAVGNGYTMSDTITNGSTTSANFTGGTNGSSYTYNMAF